MIDYDDMDDVPRVPFDERGVWLAAKTTIMSCGGDVLEAEISAAQTANAALKTGDMGTHLQWIRIHDRIREMRRERNEDEAAN